MLMPIHLGRACTLQPRVAEPKEAGHVFIISQHGFQHRMQQSFARVV